MSQSRFSESLQDQLGTLQEITQKCESAESSTLSSQQCKPSNSTAITHSNHKQTMPSVLEANVYTTP